MTLVRLMALNTIHEVLLDLGWCRPQNFTEETKIKENIDSIEILEITMELERKLSIKISNDLVDEWITISDIINTIEDLTPTLKAK